MPLRLPKLPGPALPRPRLGRRAGWALACLGGLAAAGTVAASLDWTVPAGPAARFAERALAGYGLTLTVEGPAELTLLPMPRLGFARARIATREGETLAESGRLTVELAPTALLAGRAEIATVGLDGARIDLGRRDRNGVWHSPLKALAGRLVGDADGHPRRVLLSGSTLSLRDADGAFETADGVEAVMSWPFWSASLECAGSLTWRGARTRFALSRLNAGALAGGGATPFAASLVWPDGEIAAEGTFTGGEDLRLAGSGRLQARALPRTLAWLGTDVALAPFVGDLSLEGPFEVAAGTVMMSRVAVGIGNSRLEGAMSALLAGRPSVQATLAADTLDLGPLLGGLVRLTDTAQPGASQAVALRPLTGGDLDLRLSAAASRIGPVRIEDIAASLLVRSDGIEASLSRARLAGTAVKGRLALIAAGEDGGDTELRAQGSFDRLDLGGLLADLGQERWLFGGTQGQFVLESSGRDMAALVGRPSGRAAFSIDNGTLAGLDLSDVIHRNGAVAAGALARRNGRTVFERAAVTLRFADGVGEIGDGFLKGPTVSAAIRGRLSLPERSLKAQVELQHRGGEAARRPTRFDLSGPLDRVAVTAVPLDRGGADPGSVPTALTLPAALPAGARAYAAP